MKLKFVLLVLFYTLVSSSFISIVDNKIDQNKEETSNIEDQPILIGMQDWAIIVIVFMGLIFLCVIAYFVNKWVSSSNSSNDIGGTITNSLV